MQRLALPALAALAFGSPVLAEPTPWPTYVVSTAQATPSGSGGEVAILTAVAEGYGAKPAFWVFERRSSSRQGQERLVRHEWIDGRTCPALASVLADIGKLPPARLATPGGPAGAPPPFHVATISLRGPAAVAPGGVFHTALSDWNGPVSRWWRSATQRLQSCWKTEAPMIGETPVRALIETAEDAARWER